MDKNSDQKTDQKTVLKDFFEKTTLHGVKNICKAGWIGKIVWLTVMIGCITLLVIQIQSKVDDYLANPIFTNIDVKFPDKLKFPAIAICNQNQFRISFITQFPGLYSFITKLYSTEHFYKKRSKVLHEYEQIKSSNKPLEDLNLQFFTVEDIKAIQQVDKIYNKNSTKFLMDAAHAINTTLLRCQYHGDEPCNVSKFRPILTDRAVCYALNTELSEPLQATGTDGIVLDLHLELYEYMLGPNLFEGFRILFYDQDEVPLAISRSVEASAGHATDIGMKYIVTKKLHVKDKGSCIDQRETTFYTKSHYNQYVCKMDEFFKRINTKCGCVPFNAVISPRTNATVCGLLDHFLCVHSVSDLIRQEINSFDYGNCGANCTNKHYIPSVSISRIPQTRLYGYQQKLGSARRWKSFNKSMEAHSRNNADDKYTTKQLINFLNEAIKQTDRIKLSPVMENYSESYERLQEIWPQYKSVTENAKFIADFLDLSDELRGMKNAIRDKNFLAKIIASNIRESILSHHNEQNLLEAENLYNALLEVLPWFQKRTKFTAKINRDYLMYLDIRKFIQQYLNEEITKIEWANLHLQWEKLPKVLRVETLTPAFQDVANIQDFFGHSDSITVIKDTLHGRGNDSTFWEFFNFYLAMMRPSYFMKGCRLFESLYYDYKKETLGDISDKCQITPSIDIYPLLKKVVRCALPESLKLLDENSGEIFFYGGNLEKALIDLNNHLKNYQSKWKWNADFIKENVAMLYIHYDELCERAITQRQSYDIFSLFCDIGGTMGLFLGASILTLFEFIDMAGVYLGDKLKGEQKVDDKKEIKTKKGNQCSETLK